MPALHCTRRQRTCTSWFSFSDHLALLALISPRTNVTNPLLFFLLCLYTWCLRHTCHLLRQACTITDKFQHERLYFLRTPCKLLHNLLSTCTSLRYSHPQNMHEGEKITSATGDSFYCNNNATQGTVASTPWRHWGSLVRTLHRLEDIEVGFV